MSNLSTDAYASDRSASDHTSRAGQVAGESKEAAAQAAAEVKDTAKEQVQRVGTEARTQARNVAAEMRDKVGEQARAQNDKLVGSIRQTADHLDEMRGDRPDSPAAIVVSRVADGGRQLADYLDRNGPDGVLQEVQDFARRRPGAFLATALAAGFVVGRLGKGVTKADPDAGKSDSDAFVSSYPTSPTPATYPTYPTHPASPTPGADSFSNSVAGYAPGASSGYAAGADPDYAGSDYASGTEYAATGTGTPVAVDEPNGYQNPERRP